MRKHAAIKSITATAMALSMVCSMAGAFPAMAAENLTITIKNNEGLPKMTNGQFKAYQIFKGEATASPDVSSDSEADARENEWEAEQWPNAFLSDIQWGSGIQDSSTFVTALKAADQGTWPEFYQDTNSYFKDVPDGDGSALAVAKILSGKSNAFLQEFSKFIVKGSYLNEGSAKESVLTAGAEDDAADDVSTITVDEQGYYLITDTGNHDATTGDGGATSEFILAVLGSQTVNMKASVPTVDKSVQDLGEGVYDRSDRGIVAGVSEEVEFTLTGTFPKNFEDYKTYQYIFHDTLSAGLTFEPDTLEVNVKTADGTYTLDSQASQYTVDPDEVLADPEAETPITITFEDLRKDLTYSKKDGADQSGSDLKLTADSVITVTYKAKLNTNAVLGYQSTGDTNTNKVYVEFSNNPEDEGTGKTEEKLVHVYSFGLDLKKVGDDDEHTQGLKDAGFTLKNSEGKIAKFVDKDGKRYLSEWVEESEFTTLYEAFKTADEAFDKANNEGRGEAGTEKTARDAALAAMKDYLLTSGEDGGMDVYGLDEGKYTLTEVVTPDGYDTMDPVDVTITVTLNPNKGTPIWVTVTFGEDSTTYGVLGEYEGADKPGSIFNTGLFPHELVNAKSPFLPHTGGIGAMAVYVVSGAVLLFGACIIFMAARKKNNKA